MRPEDVRPLLDQTAGRLPPPDLADAAWAGGRTIRRRRRRGAVIVLAVLLGVAALAALLAGVGGDRAEPVPPTVPPSGPNGFVPPAGVIAGMDYWVAPQPGSEPWLDRLDTPLGDSLRLPDKAARLSSQPVDRIAAVLLHDNGDRYRPLLLAADGHWAQADLELVPISTGPPLSPAAVSPDGRLVAFPQPAELVLLDGTTGSVRRVAIPSHDLRSVSWLPDSHRVLVTAKDAAYRVLAGDAGQGEQALAAIPSSDDPAGVTAPYRLEGSAGQVSLLRYVATGWTVQSTLPIPATSWVGQTFTTGNRVSRLFRALRLPQVPMYSSQPQVVAVISTERQVPSRLLVLGESASKTPGKPVPDEIRLAGCCSVAGWYDDHTVLVQVIGYRTGWLLAWDLQTARVRRVAELQTGPVAVGPGIRG